MYEYRAFENYLKYIRPQNLILDKSPVYRNVIISNYGIVTDYEAICIPRKSENIPTCADNSYTYD